MFWVAVIIIVSSLIGLISTKFLGEENPIEKAMEEIIWLETGIEIDLSHRLTDQDEEVIKKEIPKKDNF